MKRDWQLGSEAAFPCSCFMGELRLNFVSAGSVGVGGHLSIIGRFGVPGTILETATVNPNSIGVIRSDNIQYAWMQDPSCPIHNLRGGVFATAA